MQQVVIRFCGDSGDGMQLTGNLFSSLSALLGDEISTLPDYPAEIRAPQGTLGGVSGFQLNLGRDVYTPGDKADVIVAMNAAALKVCTLGSKFNHPGAVFNTRDALYKPDAIIIVDTDSLAPKDLEKALYTTDNPFTELAIPESVQVIPVALTTLTKAALADSGLDNKAMLKSRNMFALGLVCWLFDRPIDRAIHFLEGKFAKKPALIEPNTKVLVDGYNYGQNLALNIRQIVVDHTRTVPDGSPTDLRRISDGTPTAHRRLADGREEANPYPGRRSADGRPTVDTTPDVPAERPYTSIAGNKATAWGLIAAAEKAGKRLFLGSYPITPATDIMHELAARKDMGVMVVQAEDEISGVCTAIGAAFAGDLACTSTSGPGLSLKSEAIGLAVMAELPLVVIDVQRGGPSTGLPTKTEQTDLMQAVYGRNGECPAVVIAASTPANCFDYAYRAAQIALENMTPVILLTDTYLANGTSLWQIPRLADLRDIRPQGAPDALAGRFNPALRNPDTLVRYFAPAGREGFQHRNIGLERDAERGTISTNPENHEQMVRTRQAKIDRLAERLPQLTVEGNTDSDILLVGWGSTYGHLRAAAEALHCAHAHFNYINPLPANTAQVLAQYRRIVVCELNTGQFAALLRSRIEGLHIEQYNEIQGQPFAVERIIDFVKP